nr:hypothetical protein [Tanacetum cinerariifolium]
MPKVWRLCGTACKFESEETNDGTTITPSPCANGDTIITATPRINDNSITPNLHANGDTTIIVTHRVNGDTITSTHRDIDDTTVTPTPRVNGDIITLTPHAIDDTTITLTHHAIDDTTITSTPLPYFEKVMDELKTFNKECYDWLAKIPPNHWARSYFSGRAKTDILLNNLCEVFNSQLVDGRDRPIISILKYVIEDLMKRIVNVKQFIKRIDGPLTPTATRLFNVIKGEASQCITNFNGGSLYGGHKKRSCTGLRKDASNKGCTSNAGKKMPRSETTTETSQATKKPNNVVVGVQTRSKATNKGNQPTAAA